MSKPRFKTGDKIRRKNTFGGWIHRQVKEVMITHYLFDDGTFSHIYVDKNYELDEVETAKRIIASYE